MHQLFRVQLTLTPIKDRLKPDTTVKICYGYKKEDLDNPRFLVGYWSIRGLGAPLRMMLSAAKVNHWVVLYDVTEKDGGSWDKAAYMNDKEWLKKDHNSFMNNPFLVDCENDDRVISQTSAIFAYLGRELDMLGSSKQETSKCEELLCEIMDLRNLMVQFAYHGDSKGGKQDAEKLVSGGAANILDKVEMHLEKEYPNALKEDKTKICHLVGFRNSAPDFHLWEMLAQFGGLCRFYRLEQLYSDSIRPYLCAFKENFGSLPENAAYLGSALINLPNNNPYARFGSDPVTLGKYFRGQAAPWKKQGIIVDERNLEPPSKKQKSWR